MRGIPSQCTGVDAVHDENADNGIGPVRSGNVVNKKTPPWWTASNGDSPTKPCSTTDKDCRNGGCDGEVCKGLHCKRHVPNPLQNQSSMERKHDKSSGTTDSIYDIGHRTGGSSGF